VNGGVLPTAALRAALPKRYKQAARRAYLRAVAVANAGSGVTCPCCGHAFRKFARFDGRADQCPGCASLMRHRTIFLFLRASLGVPEGTKILEVGPGQALGAWLRSLDGVEYLGADLDAPGAVHADVTDLPFGDDSFDLILCLHVLEHVVDDAKALSELFRVLRPGGHAVVQVPVWPISATIEDRTRTSPEAREHAFGQWDHVRICGGDYGGRLERAGFTTSEEDYATRLDAATRLRYGLRTGEPFYLCAKPVPSED
jgi:SAM-dependent methyltransferase